MKSNVLFSFLLLLLFAPSIHAQVIPDTTSVSIETKSSGIFSGQIVSESVDSVKIKTPNLGIVAIAKSEIVYHNLYSIETIDGNEFLGEIIKDDPTSITIKTQRFGEVTILKQDIKSQKSVKTEQIKKGKYWFPNPQSTRYLWSPNGYGLKKGEGYYQNIWVLWNQFAYGVTDNFSIGGAVIPLFLFGGAPTPVFVTSKLSIPVEKNKFNIGAGVIAGSVLGEMETGFGILYGLTTFGSPDNNLTIGMGYGFADGEWASSPMININGIVRVTNRGYLITENYFIKSGDGRVVIITLGGRWIIKKAALDYGMLFPAVESGTFIGIPWLGFTIPFGKTN